MDPPVLTTQTPKSDSSSMLLILSAVFLISILACLIMKMLKRNKKTTTTKQVTFEQTDSLTLQELQVVFYGSMNCPYCRQTKDLLEEDGSWDIIEYIDTSTPEGNAAFVNVAGEGKRGIPYFISEITSESFTGFPGSIEHLTNVLGKKTPAKKPVAPRPKPAKKIEKFEDLPESYKTDTSVEFEWFGHDGCGWCKKTKAMFEESGVSNIYHNVREEEGGKLWSDNGLGGGVPFLINTATRKATRGFPGSIESLREKTA